MTKLIYIGGFGQSGTTLFEYLLTANPDAVACGEVINGFRKPSGRGVNCSCGKSVKECPVWGALEVSNASHDALLLTLLGHVEGKYALLSDASKTAWGSITAPFRLKRLLGHRFFLLHLVRDPRAVCWSAIRLGQRKKARKNRGLIKRVLSKPIPQCLRTASGWWVANLSCEIFGRLYPGQYLRILYEDVACFPRETLYAFFNAVSPGASLRLTELGANDNRHQLYGNRMRHKRLVFADVRLDDGWKSEMATGYRCLTATLSWPLRRRYHY